MVKDLIARTKPEKGLKLISISVQYPSRSCFMFLCTVSRPNLIHREFTRPQPSLSDRTDCERSCGSKKMAPLAYVSMSGNVPTKVKSNQCPHEAAEKTCARERYVRCDGSIGGFVRPEGCSNIQGENKETYPSIGTYTRLSTPSLFRHFMRRLLRSYLCGSILRYRLVCQGSCLLTVI